MDFSVSWSLSNVRRSSKVLKNSRLQHQLFRSQAFSESIISYAHLYSRNLIADVVALEQRLQDADWEHSMVYIYITQRILWAPWSHSHYQIFENEAALCMVSSPLSELSRSFYFSNPPWSGVWDFLMLLIKVISMNSNCNHDDFHSLLFFLTKFSLEVLGYICIKSLTPLNYANI